MSGYGQFCPIAVACELFARPWTPLILRELLLGVTRFNEIRRGLPRVSRTLLAQRLRDLERAGVVVRTGGDGGAYRLTRAGAELEPVVMTLGAWGQRWANRFDPDALDAEFLMWNVRRGIAVDRLPEARTVVRFDFRGLPPRYRRAHVFWLVATRPEVDLCLKDPGGDVDLWASVDLGAFARVWLGDLDLAEALRTGAIELTGPRALARAFPSWFLLSPLAAVPRPPAPAPG